MCTNPRIRNFVASIGLVPITQVSETDIFIVGYPKSGNTWFQNLVCSVNFGVHPEFTPDKLIQDLVPDVHAQSYYKRYEAQTFFKTHHLPREEHRRVIYLLRDGRDVMVSYFHFKNALRDINNTLRGNKNALSGNTINLFEFIRDQGNLLPLKWHEHVEAWLSNPYHAEIITIKYEDLKTNPLHEMKRFCEFVHLDRSEEFIRGAIERCSFENMQRQERTAWPSDKLFVRRGEIGSFRDEMPPDALRLFLSEAGQTLLKVGYL